MTSDRGAGPAKRLLALIDRGSYWTVKIVALLFLVYGIVLVLGMTASGHGAFGMLFLPIVPLIAWFLWRVKSLFVRVAIIVLLAVTSLRTLLP